MKLIDLHCDTILRCMEDKTRLGIAENDFSVDINKLQRGDSLAQFFAMYVDLEEEKDPLQRCLEMIDKFYEELEKNKVRIQIARNEQEVIENEKNKKISAFLTIEEGGVLKGELYNLRNLYRLGVRLITLTWNYPNEIGFPHVDPASAHKGLTEFGKEVVQAMNELGMLIDVSHLSDAGFYDVAKISSKPFVASHSNARAVTACSRNLTDDMIKIVAEKGGVMGINFEKGFLGSEPMSRTKEMVQHIQHIHKVGGIEVLAIGTDFDGISKPLEIENIGQVDKLVQALKQSGFSEGQIEKIFYQNAMRVIKEVIK